MKSLASLACSIIVLLFITEVYAQPSDQKPWVVYDGYDGPGNGKHIVFVSGDESYRSEEALPMLAKIMAVRHGFKVTVLFAIDPKTGEINPNYLKNIPGLHTLADADIMVLFTRFRDLPQDQMKHIIDYINAGKPIIGLRNATHAFQFPEGDQYRKYSWNSEVAGWEGGFGRKIFGETWYNHHGENGTESTRGLINGVQESHPVLRGIKDIWGPTGAYGIRNIRGGANVLVYGQPLNGVSPSAPPNYDKSIVPVAWTKRYTAESGRSGRAFVSTIGASVDFENEGLRRLLVNACYWGVGMEDEIPEKANVEYVGDYNPTSYGFDKFKTGLKPEGFVLER